MQVSQDKILALAKKVAPEKNGSLPNISCGNEKASMRLLAKGQFTPACFGRVSFCLDHGEGMVDVLEKTDNELLGIAGDKTDADIEAILKLL